MAQAWDQIGRSVIAAAQAVGGLDDKTASALQNMVTLGHGIVDLFSGKHRSGYRREPSHRSPATRQESVRWTIVGRQTEAWRMPRRRSRS